MLGGGLGGGLGLGVNLGVGVQANSQQQFNANQTGTNVQGNGSAYVGGNCGGTFPAERTQECAEIEAYVRSVDPSVAGAALVNVENQIVAGKKYIYTFNVNGEVRTVTAWSKLEGGLEVTTSAGAVINK